jgi:hypothetical protein
MPAAIAHSNGGVSSSKTSALSSPRIATMAIATMATIVVDTARIM